MPKKKNGMRLPGEDGMGGLATTQYACTCIHTYISTDVVRKFVDMAEEEEEPLSVLRGNVPRGSATNGLIPKPGT